MHGTWTCLLLVLALLFVAHSPSMAQTDVVLSGRVGVGGWMRDGHPSILHLTIENPLNVGGEGRLAIGAARISGLSRVSRVNVSLPPHSRKAIRVPFASKPAAEAVHVELQSDALPALRREFPAKLLSASDFLMAVRGMSEESLQFLVDDPHSGSTLRDYEPSRRGGGTGAHCQIAYLRSDDEMPRSLIEWRTLNAIVVRSDQAARWGDDQRRFLTDWLHGGGLLLLSPARSGALLRNGFMAELSPLRINGDLRFADMTSVARVARESPPDDVHCYQAKIQSNGHELFADRLGPLAGMRRLGRGHVIAFAFDMDGEPFRSWNGAREVWRTVLHRFITHARSDRLNRGVLSQLERIVRESGLVRPIPRMALVVPILLYGLMIFVVSLFVSRNARRREFSWVILGGLALVFGIGYSLAFRFAIRGNALIASIAVTRAASNFEGGVTQLDAATFSPRSSNADLSLAVPEGILQLPTERGPWRRSLNVHDRLDSGGTHLGGLWRTGWEPRFVAADYSQHPPLKLTAEIHAMKNETEVRIANRGRFRLHHVRLIPADGEGEWIPLPDLPAGHAAGVTTDLLARRSTPQRFDGR